MAWEVITTDLQRAPRGWSTALFQSLVSSGSMMMRMCETTRAVQLINDVVGFHPRRWEGKTNRVFSQLQKAIVFSYKFQVLLFLTSFLLCTVKLVHPPFQNTLKAALPHPLLIMVYFIFMAAFLHQAAGPHRNPGCQASRRGHVQHMQTRVRRI